MYNGVAPGDSDCYSVQLSASDFCVASSVTGTLEIFQAVRNHDVERVVRSSTSTCRTDACSNIGRKRFDVEVANSANVDRQVIPSDVVESVEYKAILEASINPTTRLLFHPCLNHLA